MTADRCLNGFSSDIQQVYFDVLTFLSLSRFLTQRNALFFLHDTVICNLLLFVQIKISDSWFLTPQATSHMKLTRVPCVPQYCWPFVSELDISVQNLTTKILTFIAYISTNTKFSLYFNLVTICVDECQLESMAANTPVKNKKHSIYFESLFQYFTKFSNALHCILSDKWQSHSLTKA